MLLCCCFPFIPCHNCVKFSWLHLAAGLLLLLLGCLLLGLLRGLLGDRGKYLSGLLIGRLIGLEILRHVESSDTAGARRKEKHSALEMGNLLPGLLVQARVGGQEAVSNTLLNSHLGLGLLLEVAKGEGKRGKLLIHLGKDISRGLHLQLVAGLNIALKDGGTEGARTDLAVSGAECNIDGVNLTLLESTFRNLLLALFKLIGGRLLESDLLDSVDDKSLHLVHPNGRDRADAVSGGNTLDGLGDVGVGGTSLDGVGSNKHSVVCRNGDVAENLVITGGGRVESSGDYKSMGGDGNVSINVAAEIDLHNIPFLEWLLLVQEGVVYRQKAKKEKQGCER